jgi:hypothetical protein
MLAQIAEEIHAPDRAAQDTSTGAGGTSDYQDLGLEVDDDDPTDIATSKVCVFLRCLLGGNDLVLMR